MVTCLLGLGAYSVFLAVPTVWLPTWARWKRNAVAVLRHPYARLELGREQLAHKSMGKVYEKKSQVYVGIKNDTFREKDHRAANAQSVGHSRGPFFALFCFDHKVQPLTGKLFPTKVSFKLVHSHKKPLFHGFSIS